MDRRYERRRRAVWLAAALLLGTGCQPGPARTSLKVAYAGVGDDVSWFDSFADALGLEARRRGHDLLKRLPAFSNDDAVHQENQNAKVRELMALDPDVLVLGPVAVNRAMEAVRIANQAGVPVMIVNRDAESPRPPSSDKYFATIHSDFFNFGREVCGKQLRRIFGNATVKLLQLKGTEGGSNTIDMNNGCREAIRADGHMMIACEDNGNYNPDEALAAARRQIASGCDFNAVFGHGDTEGLGAVQALMEAAATNPKYMPGTDPTRNVIVTSCDASRMALAAVKSRLLYGAMTTSPYYAGQVFDAIEAHFRGEEVPPFIAVNDFFIDIDNIAQYEAFGY
jgi:ABC-type sugar transport system substrate-binding protein